MLIPMRWLYDGGATRTITIKTVLRHNSQQAAILVQKNMCKLLHWRNNNSRQTISLCVVIIMESKVQIFQSTSLKNFFLLWFVWVSNVSIAVGVALRKEEKKWKIICEFLRTGVQRRVIVAQVQKNLKGKSTQFFWKNCIASLSWDWTFFVTFCLRRRLVHSSRSHSLHFILYHTDDDLYSD